MRDVTLFLCLARCNGVAVLELLIASEKRPEIAQFLATSASEETVACSAVVKVLSYVHAIVRYSETF